MMQIPPFKLERYFARYEFNVRYLLCSSDCESLTIADLLAADMLAGEPGAQERFMGHWLGYTESQGAPSLRQEIARIYRTIQPGEVLVHSGAEEAIFLFMQAALRPGDHVIVHTPCYQSLIELPRSLGCQVTRWQGDPSRGWALDMQFLKDALQPSTRLIVINTPHNPTGYLMPPDEFVELNHLAQHRGILLFSDEVYRESEHDPAERLPAACDLSETAVSLGVMSKSYGLPGLRIGWAASHNAEILGQMAALKDYTTICSSAPSEFLAEAALRQREQLAARSVALIRRNLDILDAFFSRHADLFAWQRPKAGPIAFPQYLGGQVERFCDELVTQAGVLLLPGTNFDDFDNHFRIGFGRQNLPEAVAALEKFLDARKAG